MPKALVEVGGKALVRWSVEALLEGGCQEVVVVIAESLRPDFERVLAGVGAPLRLVAGGAMRQDSVANGLAAIEHEAAVVLVHDAARPFVPSAVVAEVIAQVRAGHPCVIPALPVIDSIRGLDAGDPASSQVVDRAGLRAVQTPQGFDLATLRASHAAVAGAGEFTDDAAVCEACGHRVVLVAGSREALKVTEPLDVLVAEAIAQRRAGTLADAPH